MKAYVKKILKKLIKSKKIRNYLKLQYNISWKLRLIEIAAVFLSALVRFALLFFQFRYLASIMGEKMTDSPEKLEKKVLIKAVKVCWAVNRVSDHTFWESKCLVRALTAQFILRLFKVPSTLYLGICKDKEVKLLAHAWLRVGGLILTGEREMPGFKEVVRFSYNPKSTLK